MANQAELRQMQDALHRVSRQLQRERREHASRIKELRHNASSSSSLSKESTGTTRGPLSPSRFREEDQEHDVMPWDDFDDEATGLCYDEGVDVMADGPHSPPNQEKVGPSSKPTNNGEEDDQEEEEEEEEKYNDDAVGSPPSDTLHLEDVDFLTW
jgi:hypothetical protein